MIARNGLGFLGAPGGGGEGPLGVAGGETFGEVEDDDDDDDDDDVAGGVSGGTG